MSIESRPEAVNSKRNQIKVAYESINDLATPGDVLFFVSERTDNVSLPLLRKVYRRWIGFAPEDNSQWHTAMYTKGEKEKKGSSLRPYFVHSVAKGGVQEMHIPPSFFSSTYTDTGEKIQQGRLEVIKNPQLTAEQRTEIIEYVRTRIGQPFENRDWTHDILTWAFGIPARPVDPEKASCHGLVFDAYEHVGYSFSHRLDTAPFFNIGRHTGHPIGENADKNNLRNLHLHDHHLYRDPRFICVLSVFEEDGAIQAIENPGKYSWNPTLKEKYGV